jgi:hypothetical protein
MKLPPAFSQQEFDDDGTPLAGGKLYTYASGTLTPQTTYLDQAGSAENENPIVLDARGEYNMWLDPTLEYDLVLTRADDTAVWTKEDVAGVANATEVVTSVNELTGDVTLTAEDIEFATGTSTDWFVGTDVAAALDALIDRTDSTPAASVSIADAGNYFTGTSVEAALQELGARDISGGLLRVTQFTSSGTWTKGDDVGAIFVQAVGGGGGASPDTAGGPGGGAGGYSQKFIDTPSSSYAVTVGAGGAIGAAGASTTFGAVITCVGGTQGAAGDTAGGLGGVSSGGDLNLRGGSGEAGGDMASNAVYGKGGDSYFGGSAPGDWNRTVGVAGGANTGGGGAGGTSGAGGTGGSGLVLVFEYS